MCWVMTSTKFAVVQWESSVGGSRDGDLEHPPFFGVCAGLEPGHDHQAGDQQQ